MWTRTVKVLSKNVLKIVEDLKTGSLNYMDFQEDYDFLTIDDKKELFAILNFVGSNLEQVEFMGV